MSQPSLDGGSYEIIRRRLEAQGAELKQKLARLNALRHEVFGGVGTELLTTDRVVTENNCIPRDMLSLGQGLFLFGYNVHMGLRSKIEVADVFSIYRYDSNKNHTKPLYHLRQYENAIPIIERAIENDPKNFYFYRELGFSYANLNKIKDAERIYRKGIKMSDNDFEKSEMAVNMAQAYFKLKNKKKFDEWAELTRKYSKANSQYVKYIEHFEVKNNLCFFY